MPTKDPHHALIDAHQQLDEIKMLVHYAARMVQAKIARGEKPSEDDRLKIAAIKAEAIERTKKIQDQLLEELESHGKLT
jgi:hypothetical protein